MNKRFLILAASLVFAASIATADTIKIKFNDLAELGGALRSLDATEKEVKTADQGTRIIKVPLDLKPAARIAVAKNLASVRGALEAFEQQRQALLQRVSPGAIEKIQSDQALLGKFAQAWNDLIKEPIVLDVVLITDEQLNLEANKEIGGTVLAGLAPILAPPKK
jgi:hypothetical protein